MEIVTAIEGKNKVERDSITKKIREIDYGIPHLAISERFPNFAFSYFEILFSKPEKRQQKLTYCLAHSRMQVQNRKNKN